MGALLFFVLQFLFWGVFGALLGKKKHVAPKQPLAPVPTPARAPAQEEPSAMQVILCVLAVSVPLLLVVCVTANNTGSNQGFSAPAAQHSQPGIAPVTGGAAPGAGGSVWVNGYQRQDGTIVPGHFRSRPDSTPANNWSVKPNVNPHTV